MPFALLYPFKTLLGIGCLTCVPICMCVCVLISATAAMRTSNKTATETQVLHCRERGYCQSTAKALAKLLVGYYNCCCCCFTSTTTTTNTRLLTANVAVVAVTFLFRQLNNQLTECWCWEGNKPLVCTFSS